MRRRDDNPEQLAEIERLLRLRARPLDVARYTGCRVAIVRAIAAELREERRDERR